MYLDLTLIVIQKQGGEIAYVGDALKALPEALAKFAEMQSGPEPILRGGITVVYKVTKGGDPAAILQVFYNVLPFIAPFTSFPFS